ncbi:MAG TPA: ATP-dependent DNA ligase [Candidatus Nanoarchaeia archaeon]|nr:ATP-dependent DNA ligase [Candidatus Nanoarchaeia archaeon]
MEYKELAKVYEKLESTSKRLEKTSTISDLLKRTPADELETIMLLLEGKIFANWDASESGVASKIILKAISLASGESKDRTEAEWKKTGDLGKAAQNLLGRKKQNTLFSKELTVKKVMANLRKLPSMEGHGSVDRKVQLIAELLTSSSSAEAKFIVKTVLSELRIGVGEGSLRDAIVWANFGDKIGIKLATEEDDIEIENREQYALYAGAVQQAYDLTNDFGIVARTAATQGLDGLQSITLKVGTPIKVMLAIKADTIEEGMEIVGTPCEAEFKYDGFRVQIHKDEHGKITLFTRRLEDVTAQFPEIVRMAKTHIDGKSYLLDCEAVGFDSKTQTYLPFQSISQRIKRKYDIEKLSQEIPVEVNVFDVLSLDGRSYLQEPFSERRKILDGIIKDEKKRIVKARSIISSSKEEIEKFYRQSLKSGNEGIMLKSLEAPYKPGARVGHMVKLKPVMETLDLVIVGAEWGEGKRSDWLSSYIIACQDEDGNLLEVGRVSTGLKEKEEEGLTFREMTRLLKPLIIVEKGKEVKVRPSMVLEVDYEEIQKSPTYKSGYALRFPRVKGLREDRGADDISTLKMVEEFYRKQK